MDSHFLQNCVKWPTTVDGIPWHTQAYDVIVGPRVNDVTIPALLAQKSATIPDILNECQRFEDELKFLLQFTFGNPPPPPPPQPIVIDEEDADVDVEGNSSSNGSLVGGQQNPEICGPEFVTENVEEEDEKPAVAKCNVAFPHHAYHPNPEFSQGGGDFRSVCNPGLGRHPMDAVFDLPDTNGQTAYMSHGMNNGGAGGFCGQEGQLKLEIPDGELNFWKNDSVICGNGV